MSASAIARRRPRLFDYFVCVDVLFDNEVSVVAFDDVFDLGDLVSWEDAESVCFLPQALVLGGGEAHNGHAVRVGALADQVVLFVPLVSELNDSLVDVSKQKLVLGQAFLLAAHLRPYTRWNTG